ncbi:MAG: ATPase P [Tissierellia bacterium]|nr:ATPase P [Tissierellia bacterium]MDD4779623.1 ATPase P [Tissierellia bacterium]
MMNIDIPGRGNYIIENIVFDFNGTIAVDGKISENIKEKLNLLSKMVNIYVLTADTYGSAAKECEGLNLTLKTFPKGNASDFKAGIVSELGSDKTICYGNGFNDIKMFNIALLSIAILGAEGVCGSLLQQSDVLVKSIEDGINLLLKPDSLIATLRS